MFRALVFLLLAAWMPAADLPGSRDPEGIRRFAGSGIIGYQAPRQEEYYYSKGKGREFGKPNPFGAESVRLEGLVSRWTYLIPSTDTTALEVFTSCKTELANLGLETVYAPEPDQDGWFGPAYAEWEQRSKLGQILDYNEAEERYLVTRSRGENPSYYVLFVTAFKDGMMPDSPALKNILKRKMPLLQLDIIQPAATGLERTLAVNSEADAEGMRRKMDADGSVAIHSIFFDSDKDTLKAESAPALEQIAMLLKKDPLLKLYVVGHTDRLGPLEFNRDLSERRAKAVVRELTSRYQISAARLAAAGVAFLAPIAPNSTEEGRAQNRRVVLIPQEK
jgi:outer membrane protein OmpA-like peptidoglycan-associated protein